MKRLLILVYERIYNIIMWLRDYISNRVFYRLRIMSSSQTLKLILDKKLSVARYGEGELDYFFQLRDVGFQKPSIELEKKLKEALSNKNPNLLNCVARSMNSTLGLNSFAKHYWFTWGRNGHQREIVKIINETAGKHYRFGDALITRPYMDYKSPKHAERLFPMLKKLWNRRDIIIVEGSQTRMGIGNDLYDNAKSIKRIIAPAINAFESYDEILDSIVELYHGELIIMALGPTATVLASDLANKNIQALDLGHLDIEYEWFLKGAKEKVAIEGKFVNEVGVEGRKMSVCNDEKYISQIVRVIE